MDIRPIKLRSKADEHYEAVLANRDDANFAENLVNVIDVEVFSDYHYRTAFLKGLIYANGLGEHEEDIFSGMKRSRAIEPPINAPPDENPLKMVDRLRFNSDTMLRSAIDYVERWMMYEHLFGREYFGGKIKWIS